MSAENLSLYDQAHLIVSAVRLFSYREKRLPTAEEIAAMAGFSLEVTHLVCNRLLELGVLQVVRGAFGDRYDVKDHRRIEELPRSVDKAEMTRAIDEFRSEKTDRQKKMENMFHRKEFEKKRREQMKELEKKFRERSSKKRQNPFD